jgi:transcriptional regulator of arginine metabolism
MKGKGPRQAALLRLVRRRSVSSQDEMVRLLHKRGFSATQSSISRDVRELGLVRVNGRYVPATRVGLPRSPGVLPDRDSELIIAAEPVGANLIVVKTSPGSANAVAIDVDREELPEIAGTVAGDDTIFIAVRSRAAQGHVLAMLRGALGGDPGRH